MVGHNGAMMTPPDEHATTVALQRAVIGVVLVVCAFAVGILVTVEADIDLDEWWNLHTMGIGSTAHTLDGLDADAIARIRAAAHTRFGDGPVEITGTAWAARGLVPAE